MSPLRQACDRCHSIKTRCVKSQRQHNCVRCERLGVQCVYSQPVKTGRPLGSSKAKQQAAQKRASPPIQQQPQQQEMSGCEFEHTASDLIHVADLEPAFTAPTPFTESPISTSLSTASNEFFQSLSEGSISAQSWEDDDAIFPQPTTMNDFEIVDPSMFTSPMMDFFDVQHQTPNALAPVPNLIPINPLLGLKEHSIMDRGRTTDPASQEDRWLQHFTELQSRLTRLVRSISSSENVLIEAEQLYEATETLELATGDEFTASSGSSPSLPPSGVAVLLLSSCYYTLMHAYSSLIQRLQQELRQCSALQQQQKIIQQQQTSPQSGHLSIDHHNNRTNPSLTDPTLGPGTRCHRDRDTPTLSIGSVQMRLSRQASLEINLFLAVQTLRRTRGSVQQSITRAAVGLGGPQHQQISHSQLNPLPSPASETGRESPRAINMGNNPKHDNNNLKHNSTVTESMWTSLEAEGLFNGSGLGDRAEAALSELRHDEEKMFARLGSSMFMFN